LACLLGPHRLGQHGCYKLIEAHSFLFGLQDQFSVEAAGNSLQPFAAWQPLFNCGLGDRVAVFKAISDPEFLGFFHGLQSFELSFPVSTTAGEFVNSGDEITLLVASHGHCVRETKKVADVLHVSSFLIPFQFDHRVKELINGVCFDLFASGVMAVHHESPVPHPKKDTVASRTAPGRMPLLQLVYDPLDFVNRRVVAPLSYPGNPLPDLFRVCHLAPLLSPQDALILHIVSHKIKPLFRCS
jgi:hypothetical protein